MNEMQVLERFRTDVPDADPAVLARGRSALLATAPPRRHRYRITLPRLAIGSGAVGMAAAVTAVAVTLSLAGGGATATAATALLNTAATRAAAEPAATVHGGQYTFIETLSRSGGNGGTDRHEQDWWPVSGKGTSRMQVAFGDQPYEVWPTTGHSKLCDTGPCLTSPPLFGRPSYDYLASLPTDTGALKKIVYQQADDMVKLLDPDHRFGPYTRDSEAFNAICITLTYTVAPPKVRAALLKVAAQIPGTTLVQDVVDAAGRHGVGVKGTFGGKTPAVLIFDRKTYQVLGNNVDAGGAGGIEDAAVVRTGIVDHIGQLP
jgi:hypothetical protein